MSSWQDRTALLFGTDTLTQFQQAKVMIVGLGGVGGIAAEMIARSGIGSLAIADGDVVDDTNRNRQIAALTSTVGKPKAEVLADRIRQINPKIHLSVFPRFFEAEEMQELIKTVSPDCVVDAIDTLAPKIALIRASVSAGIPVVSSMGSGAHINPECIRCVPVMKTFNCPLAKAVRNGLKELSPEQLQLCHAVFTTEPPVKSAIFDTGECKNHKRAVLGTVSYLPAAFGCHCAAGVLRILREAHP